MGIFYSYDIPVRIALLLVAGGDPVFVRLADDADNGLTGDGSGFGVGPDGIQSVGLDAYQSAVAPRTVGIVIVADLRRNVSHRHLAGRLALAYAGSDSGLTGGKSGDHTVLDLRNHLVVSRPSNRHAILQGGGNGRHERFGKPDIEIQLRTVERHDRFGDLLLIVVAGEKHQRCSRQQS